MSAGLLRKTLDRTSQLLCRARFLSSSASTMTSARPGVSGLRSRALASVLSAVALLLCSSVSCSSTPAPVCLQEKVVPVSDESRGPTGVIQVRPPPPFPPPSLWGRPSHDPIWHSEGCGASAVRRRARGFGRPLPTLTLPCRSPSASSWGPGPATPTPGSWPLRACPCWATCEPGGRGVQGCHSTPYGRVCPTPGPHAPWIITPIGLPSRPLSPPFAQP